MKIFSNLNYGCGSSSSNCGDGNPHMASQNWSMITQAWTVIPKEQLEEVWVKFTWTMKAENRDSMIFQWDAE